LSAAGEIREKPQFIHFMNFTILKYERIDSTNTEALDQARRGADEGLCIVAREQTAGRGRHGRTWVSEKDTGLYFSLILRPELDMDLLPLITLMAAVAVHDALEKMFHIECDIKWVNDIHVNQKKICGILAETTETEKGQAVVVGIGINFKSSNFPPELASTVTAIETEAGAPASIENFLPVLTAFLEKFCDVLYAIDGPRKIRQEWTKRSSYASGKNVRAAIGTETICGVTRGIEENGALRLEVQSGEIKIIHAGEIEQLRKI
jgi:BirA family biotin operon repressor/biotin-[acetyl-CoA-carboxylase] ligase